jgi:hypothetical protein
MIVMTLPEVSGKACVMSLGGNVPIAWLYVPILARAGSGPSVP